MLTTFPMSQQEISGLQSSRQGQLPSLHEPGLSAYLLQLKSPYRDRLPECRKFLPSPRSVLRVTFQCVIGPYIASTSGRVVSLHQSTAARKMVSSSLGNAGNDFDNVMLIRTGVGRLTSNPIFFSRNVHVDGFAAPGPTK